MRPYTGRAVPGSRHFDSLGMCLRAFELVRIWRNGVEARKRNAALCAMPRDRIERTERAAHYLHRRICRTEGRN